MSDVSETNYTSPAKGATVITPSNNELPRAIRMLTVGTAGIVAFTGVDGVDYTTASLPPGNYPMAAIRILPATTAGTLTGWF